MRSGFTGCEDEWLQQEIEAFGLSHLVKQNGQIPKNIAIEKQQESQLLLLLNWEDQREKGVIPQKIYDYLSALRPILSLGGSGNDVIEQLLNETRAGIYCSTSTEALTALAKFYSEFKYLGNCTLPGKSEKDKPVQSCNNDKKVCSAFQ